jgi:hypothetical protein
MLCMAVALVANAALLHAVDVAWGMGGVVSVLNLACYAAFLSQVTAASLLARALAIMALGAAFMLRDCVLTNWRLLQSFDGLIFALNFKFGDAKAVPTMPTAPLPLIVVARLMLQWMLERMHGMLAEHCASLNILAALVIAVGAVRPFHHPMNCYWWGYLGGAAAGAPHRHLSCASSASIVHLPDVSQLVVTIPRVCLLQW